MAYREHDMKKKLSPVIRQNLRHLKSILKIKPMFLVALFFTSGLGILYNPNAVYAGIENDLYLFAQSFTWKEFLGNATLLEESGPLYGFGCSGKLGGDISQPFAFHYKVEGFMGYIDYDGQTQTGTPLTSDTRYLGFKTELGGGWNIFAGESGFSFEPFAGLGYRWWLRDITDSSSGIGYGYEEIWRSYYGRLGIRGEKESSGQFKIFMEAAAIIPFYNENVVNLEDFGLGTVTVEPGNVISLWAEAGLKFKKFRFSVFYEGLRFSESDIQEGFYQPKSEADIYGVNMGFTF
jgi:hypothetical protein